MYDPTIQRREHAGPRRVKIRRLPFNAILRIMIALGAPLAVIVGCVSTGLVVAAVRVVRGLVGGFSSRTITGPLNFQITINPIEILGMQDAVTQIQRTDDGMFVASIFIFIIIVLVAEASLVLVGFFGGILSDLIIWATGGITLDVEDA